MFKRVKKERQEINAVFQGVVFRKDIRQQESIFAQFLKILLGNVNSNLNCQIFDIQYTPSKITRYGVYLPREITSSYLAGYNCANIQQQLNAVASGLIFEETSVDS